MSLEEEPPWGRWPEDRTRIPSNSADLAERPCAACPGMVINSTSLGLHACTRHLPVGGSGARYSHFTDAGLRNVARSLPVTVAEQGFELASNLQLVDVWNL